MEKLKSPRAGGTVPCQYCGDPTSMIATALCDRCYDIERAVRFWPEIVKRIQAATAPALCVCQFCGATDGQEICAACLAIAQASDEEIRATLGDSSIERAHKQLILEIRAVLGKELPHA